MPVEIARERLGEVGNVEESHMLSDCGDMRKEKQSAAVEAPGEEKLLARGQGVGSMAPKGQKLLAGQVPLQ